jgi:hypothetical protein
VEIEELVKPHVRREVEKSIEKREQSDHSPILDYPLDACDPAEWRYSQRGEQQDQRPQAGSVRDFLDGIRTKRPLESSGNKQGKWHKGGDKDDRLQYSISHGEVLVFNY